MTDCTVCGEKDFEELDGHYYCTTCNTQSQDFRVMVVDEEEVEWLGHSNVIRDKKSKDNKEKKATADLGRPWSIYEAFQIIIQHQVEALIKLGADPRLSDLVFKIWRNYLSRLGVAFSDQPLVEQLQKYGRQREKFPGTLKNPKTQNVLGSSRKKKTLGPSSKQTEKQMMMDAVEGEEFYEGDNPVDAVGDDEKNEDEYSSAEETEMKLCGRRLYSKSLAANSCYKMTMARTLAFCYLGLMYTNPLVTLSDIIRWAKTHKIPFRSVTSILPSDMKFALSDWMLFGMDMVPSFETLSSYTGSLAFFLGLQNIPEFPLRQLISKYLLQLCLPGEMHSMVMKLIMMDNISTCYIPKKTNMRIVFWEGIAMAHIIVTLKMLFGLNNRTERLLSEYTQQLMKINPAGEQLFVFNDWITYMRKGFNISKLNFLQGSDDALTEVESIRTKDSVTYVDGPKNKRLYKPTCRDKLQAPFLELSKQMKIRQSCVNDVPSQSSIESNSEFDLTTNTLLADNPVGYLLGHYDNESPENSQKSQERDERQERRTQQLKRIGEEFRKSSIKHLINPDEYLNRLENEQVIGDAVYKPSVSSVDSSSECGITELSDGGCVYSSPRKKRKLNRKSEAQLEEGSKSSVRQCVESPGTAEPETSTVMDRSRHQDLRKQIKYPQDNYQLTFDNEDTALTSYYGVVEICAHVIGCPREQVQNEVRKIEMKHFADYSDMSKAGKRNLKFLKRSRTFATKRIKTF